MTTDVQAPPDLLETIVAATRRALEIREQRRGKEELAAGIAGRTAAGGTFVEALREARRFNVIAECKRRSPSRGVIRADYQPAAIADAYAGGGAAAISVLTEPAFFDGALEHLVEVRERVGVPLLRKDFIIDGYQLLEAVEAGANAILLIVAALEDPALRRLTEEAHQLGLAVLTEVHSQAELERALAAGADIVGVNNRNLRTLEVDLAASETLVDHIPDELVAVAESGLRTASDLVALRAAGYDAFLIGESLMSQDDPGTALVTLLADAGVPSSPRGRRGVL